MCIRDQARQVTQQGALSVTERAWLCVHHGDGTQCITVAIDDWGAGVKAQMRGLCHQRVSLKPTVQPQVFHDKRLVGPHDGMRAKCNLAIELRYSESKL